MITSVQEAYRKRLTVFGAEVEKFKSEDKLNDLGIRACERALWSLWIEAGRPPLPGSWVREDGTKREEADDD